MKQQAAKEKKGCGEPGAKKRGPELNRLDHGGRSNTLVMPSEDESQWEELLQAYLDDYVRPGEPGKLNLGKGCAGAERLAVETAKQHWFSLRAERNLMRMELSLDGKDCLDWTPEEHKKLQLFYRYKTAADRSLWRAMGMLESFRRTRVNEEAREWKSQLTAQKIAWDMQTALARERIAVRREARREVAVNGTCEYGGDGAGNGLGTAARATDGGDSVPGVCAAAGESLWAATDVFAGRLGGWELEFCG